MELRPDAAESRDLIEEAVQVLIGTNRCDHATAREILASTARRNRLDEHDVAVTLLALSNVRRTSRPPLI